MKRLSSVAVFVVVALIITSAWAQPLSSAQPEQVGLSSPRLDRIGQLLKTDVGNGQIPGAVALVARKGRIAYFESVGFRDKETGAPMPRSEERRVGKECRSRWAPWQSKKKW